MAPEPLGLDCHVVVRRTNGFSLDLAVTIQPGETLCLLGPNGAGKSTVVEVVAGLVPLDEGHIRLNDRLLDSTDDKVFIPPEARRIGVVFQDYLLFDHLDVLANIAFGPTSSGTPKRVARKDAQGWVGKLGLEGLEHHKPGELSGGQAQRVALARALAVRPDLLLLDEPLAALDVGTRNRLRRTLGQHLKTFEGPRLLITHDPTDAFLLADTVVVLEAGRVTQRGTPAQIRRHPATPYVAAVAGTNLLTGTNNGGTLTIDDVAHTLATSDTQTGGRVLITVHPRAIALHPSQPHGSPRNTWLTSVGAIEPLGDTVRILLADPLPLTADITPSAAEALGLRPGSPIWAAVKATEISVSPA